MVRHLKSYPRLLNSRGRTRRSRLWGSLLNDLDKHLADKVRISGPGDEALPVCERDGGASGATADDAAGGHYYYYHYIAQ